MPATTPTVDAPQAMPPRRFRRTRIAVSVFFAILLFFPLGLVWRGGASGMPLVLLLLAAALIAVPWFPFSTRFSLRTILIVTTLVAIVLGLGVWLAY